MSQESHNDDWLAQQLSAFAEAWQQGAPPEIADFLPSAQVDPAARRRLLHELILIDLEYRWHRHVDPATTVAFQPASTGSSDALHARPRLDDYIRRYPDIGPLAALTDELIVCEFRLRKRWGDLPVVDAYRAQFGPGREALWTILEEISAENETNHDLSLHDTQRFPARQALKIRCPHCHNPVEILDDQSVTEITCPSCDTVFSLVGQAGVQPGAAATPRRFGHFELIEQVGEGAFGAVWKARDTQLERIVAVKIPRRTQLDAKDIEQFIREARAAAQLKHPNIVSVHEAGREQETVYIVSDFIEGLSLDKWLAGQPRTPTEAAELCRKIAVALHHAHEAGIVHRDLKPSNIMIDAAGEPHVMDFGLAKREAGEITMTVEGQILGTPAYMSPEQAKGEGHKADRRSDVYSLGVILFELLTGERPFRGNVRMLLQQVLEDAPPSPRKLDSRIPRDLETITLKCLEKELSKRFLNALALSNELDRFVDGRPILARPITRPERAWRWCKRNPAVAGLSAATALTLLVGIVATSIFALYAKQQATEKGEALAQLQPERDRAEQEATLARLERDRADQQAALALEREADATAQKSRADAEKKRAVTEEQKSARRLYNSQIARVQQLWNDGQFRAACDQLGRCDWDYRGWEHDYLYTKLFARGRFAEHTKPVLSVAFSPDGKQIASGSVDNTIKVWDATSGKERLTLNGHTGGVTSVAFSPDGKRIASSGDNTIKVWDAASGEETLSLKGHTNWVSVAFSPDGKRIASGSEDHTITVWDATSGEETMTLKGHAQVVRSVAFSPDGMRIASGSHDNTVKVWDAASGEETLSLKGHTNWVNSVAFSPDGKRIASSGDLTIRVWDAATGVETMTIKGPAGVDGVAYSPDGKRIASGAYDTIKVWDATSGEETMTIKGHTNFVTDVAFSPDGTRIVSGSTDKTIRVWNATAGEETMTIKGHASGVNSVAFSPDGKRIASGSFDIIKVWDATSGEETMTIKGLLGVTGVAFSPDGTRIASDFEEHTIKVWDAISGEETLTIKGGNTHYVTSVHSVAFSPDGKRIASGVTDLKADVHATILKVRDATSGEEALTLKGHTGGVTSVAFSPDGKRIVSGSEDKTIRVWDATSGEETLSLKGHAGWVFSVAFSPDGKRIVSGSMDKTIKVWNAASGEETLSLKGHTNWVNSVAFSPDGKRIASGSHDNTVKVWDATSGEETLSLKGHAGWVFSVAFSPDGKRIVSGSGDKTLKVWDATVSEER